MPDLVDAIKNYVKSPKKHFDTDEVDQLNFFITPLLLFVGCLLIALKQYFGTPIQCWVPAEFTKTFEQYTEAFCFSQNTYFVKSGAPLPEIESRKAGEIDYYQWVPLFLFLQGSLFYIPHAIWSFLNNKNESIVKMSVDLSVAMDVDSKELETVAEHIYTGITQHKELKKKDSLSSFVHRSRYLVTCYLFTKGLYLLQILVQYYLMHTIIGTKSNFWGYEFAKNFFEGKDWEETGHFPRETMCDFSVRYPGTHRRVTVQCVLIVNMINEKLYLFLWFYLIFVFVATALNILSWAWVLFFSSCRLNFVQSTMLECADWDNFVEKFLKIDGVFVMMLINKNAGSLTTHDIFQALWKIYAKEKANKEKVVEKNPKEDGAFNGDVPGAEA